MSVRNSGYERIAGDNYQTPAWVTEAILSVESFEEPVWEPACDGMKILDVLWKHFEQAAGSGLSTNCDFLKEQNVGKYPSIITNPPFSLAEKFVRHALNLTESYGGKVAMLLPMQWDAAKTRRDLFENPPFKAKYTLTKRIRWENLEQKKAGPSMNHAWYVWDWGYEGKPFMGWLPKVESVAPLTTKGAGA